MENKVLPSFANYLKQYSGVFTVFILVKAVCGWYTHDVVVLSHDKEGP